MFGRRIVGPGQCDDERAIGGSTGLGPGVATVTATVTIATATIATAAAIAQARRCVDHVRAGFTERLLDLATVLFMLLRCRLVARFILDPPRGRELGGLFFGIEIIRGRCR